MGHHINKEGQFQSDKYPDLPPDKIILSFKDTNAKLALAFYVNSVLKYGGDKELAEDIQTRLETLLEE